MSRCFPYPPPGYEAREIDKGLIESIKLQKEIEKAKKERRREKKKEKKEKGDKSREDGVKGDKNRTSEKRHKEEGNQVEQYPDKKHGVVEQLEKSSLTEEYGRPANRASSDSSDSTQNSTCKRKRAAAAPVLCDTPCSQVGSGLRLRLSFKHKDQKSISLVSQTPSPSVSSRTPKDVIAPSAKDDSLLVKGSKHLCQELKKLVSGKSIPGDFSRALHVERNDIRWNQDQKVCEPSCSTSGRTVEVCHSSSLKDDRETANDVVARENKIQEISCSTSGRAIESLPVPKADGSELHPKEKKHKKRSRGQKMEDKFRELFMDWSPVPLNLPPACGDDDQDWLSVESKQPCKQEVKRSRVADDSLWSAAGPGGPRASLLCEADDIYALPYVQSQTPILIASAFIPPLFSVRCSSPKGIMSSDLDLLDDVLLLPANMSVRPAGKFRPKAKSQPKNEHPNQLSSIPSDSGCPKQTSPGITSSDLPSSRQCSASHTDYPAGVETLQPTIYRSDEDPVSLGNTDSREVEGSIMASPRAVQELGGAPNDPLCDVAMATEFFTGFESLDDLPLHASSSTGVDLVSPPLGSEGAVLNHADLPQAPSMEFSTVSPGSSAPLDSSVQLSEATFFYVNKDLDADHGSKEATGFSGLESLDDIFLEPTSSLAKVKGKFRPKPKTRTVPEQLLHSSGLADAMESSFSPMGAQCYPTGNGCTREGSTTCKDASADFSRILPCENAGLEFSHVKDRKRKSSNPSEDVGNKAPLQELQQVTSASEELDGGKSSRKLRKRIVNESPVNESDAETEDYMDDDEYRGEKDIPENNRTPTGLQDPTATNGNQADVHIGESELPDSANKKPPKKKFSHSTRRNRRLVNKELLDTPEDEIDPTKLILKDLILLADIKERKINKEAAALKKSFRNPSSNEDDPSASDSVEPSSFKLNYHSFMVKSPKERWSPPDTKLFYEAIRQFGSDFAMIQQLFPGKTRHQIKLKFKAEERKHPMQIADALMHRSKDHSHFQTVIERLQAQAEHDSNRGSQSPTPTDENEDQAAREEPELENEYKKEEVAKTEEYEAKDGETEVHSPQVSEEIEAVYDWDNYKSVDDYSLEETEKVDYSSL
ncbi:hypothetical protein H6P81_018570 [Aristolochia fimbriata]|uniref:SANT domain-containing protein n=1 Tax=Aristolochia fimbriata TaxID=158543 RepID=A0AAV7E2Z2_ARIFI|nr:hypothetical protein H6P81_018570 [Aristolochia fimbriata]